MNKQNSKEKQCINNSHPTSQNSLLTTQNGITLVALVVTIIVLLILAGVTITSLLGDDGIISKAQQAANATKKSQVIESVRMDILMAQLEGNLTQEKLEEILDNYGEIQYDGEGNITGLKPDGLEETIPIEDLLTGEVSEGEPETPDTTAPTANISLNTTSTTPGAAIEATVTHTDNESGIATANCKYIFDTTSGNLGIDSTSWDTASSFDSNPQTLSLAAEAEGTYYLHVLTVDVAGNKGETISEAVTVEEDGITAEDIAEDILTNPETYYGKTVSGYTCTNSSAVSNWKIFYVGNDFSADGSYHIYLITDDYIPYESIPRTLGGRSLEQGSYGRDARATPSVLREYAGSANITDGNIKLLNSDFFNKTTGEEKSYARMKWVAYMLDTKVWSVFKGSNADYAVGAPSIEMTMKSYSQKYGVDYRAQASSNMAGIFGYDISNNGGSSWGDEYKGMLSENDTLYVLPSSSGAPGCWISSPATRYETEVFSVWSDGDVLGMNCNGGTGYGMGFRPLVCLSSNVELKQLEDGNFAIK